MSRRGHTDPNDPLDPVNPQNLPDNPNAVNVTRNGVGGPVPVTLTCPVDGTTETVVAGDTIDPRVNAAYDSDDPAASETMRAFRRYPAQSVMCPKCGTEMVP